MTIFLCVNVKLFMNQDILDKPDFYLDFNDVSRVKAIRTKSLIKEEIKNCKEF